MKITNDKMAGRSAQSSQYDDVFSQLTPEKNCLVFDDKKEMDRVSQALDGWARRFVKGGKVRTTKSYYADKKPRCWLIFPAEAIPPKTTIAGNWPKAVK